MRRSVASWTTSPTRFYYDQHVFRPFQEFALLLTRTPAGSPSCGAVSDVNSGGPLVSYHQFSRIRGLVRPGFANGAVQGTRPPISAVNLNVGAGTLRKRYGLANTHSIHAIFLPSTTPRRSAKYHQTFSLLQKLARSFLRQMEPPGKHHAAQGSRPWNVYATLRDATRARDHQRTRLKFLILFFFFVWCAHTACSATLPYTRAGQPLSQTLPTRQPGKKGSMPAPPLRPAKRSSQRSPEARQLRRASALPVQSTSEGGRAFTAYLDIKVSGETLTRKGSGNSNILEAWQERCTCGLV